MSLVSLNDYKEFARISQSDVNEDEKLQRIADETEAEVKEFLCRDLESATYTEKYDGEGEDDLALRQFPITSVSKIEIYQGATSGVEDWDELVLGTDYNRLVIDPDGISIYLDGYVFPEGDLNVRITYVAGYTEIPQEIQRACKQLFTLNYNEQEGRRTIGLSAVGVGAEKTVSIDLDAHDKILKRIEKYKALNV